VSWRALLGAPLLLAMVAAHGATASLRDAAQLEALLKQSPQCCVIDARSAERRAASPLDGSLAWRRDLHIEATSIVVVVGDTDVGALEVARVLVKRAPHDVVAVKGGLSGWQAVLTRLEAAAREPGSPYTFVIPRNTCQQDTPLHVFEAKPAQPAMSTPKAGSR
jgi:hypothetical protein